jgi:hypothetical protein
MSCPDFCGEIKAGGVKGFFGLDQVEWNGPGGKFYEFWKCNPCCGAPDLNGCLHCCMHFWPLGWLTYCRVLAWTQGQEAAIIPHCLCLCFCPHVTRLTVRYNLRKKTGQAGNICGDFWCVYVCNLCACAQELRQLPKEAWSMFPPPLIQAPKNVLCV